MRTAYSIACDVIQSKAYLYSRGILRCDQTATRYCPWNRPSARLKCICSCGTFRFLYFWFFRDLMTELQVKIKRSKPRTPQSNGRVEALNKTICSIVLALSYEHADWSFAKILRVGQSVYK